MNDFSISSPVLLAEGIEQINSSDKPKGVAVQLHHDCTVAPPGKPMG
jgi:hypothetical protein